MNKKGVSSIIGAVFMILILGSLASAYFFFTLQQNTIYNDALRTENQRDVARMSENVQALDTAFRVNSNNIVTVTVKIQNNGPTPVELVTIWVHANQVSGSWSNYNFAKISVTLQGGQTLAYSFDVPISGLATSESYTFASWLISSKGNSFSLQAGKSNTVTFASVAAGIGSIAMDTKAFRQYTVTSSILGPASPSYQVDHKSILAFSVDLVNFDVTGKDLSLTSLSSIWILNPPDSAGAVKGCTWQIAKVTENTIAVLPAGQSIPLPYGQLVKVYFYSSSTIGNQLTAGASGAVNLLLVGSIATTPSTDYGQNLPFIAVTIT